MAISSVLTYTEPEQMEAAHVAAQSCGGDANRRSRGLAWHVYTRRAGQCSAGSAVQESGPRIRYVELDPGRAFLSFLVRPGTDSRCAGS